MGIIKYIKNQIWHDRNMKNSIAEEMHRLNRVESVMDSVLPRMRMDYLRDKTMHTVDSGISADRYCDTEVIVSLTSFGKRIHDVFLAVEAIMQGTLKPNRIVLWLAEEEFGGKSLPILLQKQQMRGLEVRYCEDLRSYKKLIPSLCAFPDACIVTIDDDVMLEYDLVERLVKTHIESPDSICACRTHKIRLDKAGRPMSYLDWEYDADSEDDGRSPLVFATGVGGVLYPPHCFSSEVFNKDVFTRICPYADDIWFYAMALMNKRKVKKVYTSEKPCFMDIPSWSIGALSEINTNHSECLNDVQLKAVFDKYQLYSKLTDA